MVSPFIALVWLYLVLLLPASLHAAPQGDGGYIDGACWWCEDSETFPSAKNVTTEEFEPEEDATMCECVPWYLCGNNAIITDGAGLLDLRTIPVRNVKNCPDPMQTCCGIPVDDPGHGEKGPGGLSQELPQELPPNTPCDCVSYRECPEHLIVNNGKGKTCLNVATSSSSHSKCPHATDVCCANATEVALGLTSAINDGSLLENGECVGPHLCDKHGYFKTEYDDTYNDYIQPVENKPQVQRNAWNYNNCSNSGMVYCRPRVECECVNQNQCDEEGFIITDGSSLIDLRVFGSQSQGPGTCDDPCQVCCKHREEEEINPTPIPDIITPSSVTSNECYCVEKSQCSSYNSEPDYNYGVGMLDIRSFEMECSNPEHICCDVLPSTTTTTTPPTTPTTPPPIPTCGMRNRQGTINLRIMGFRDDQSQFGEFPWVATVLREELIMNKPHHLFVGGGTLIHPRVVLTAAHKIHTLSSDKLHIRLGEWDTQTVKEPLEHQDLEVEKVVIHPNFNINNLKFDVGLIFLKEDAALKSHIQPLCLANDISEVDPNDCVINGWGKDGFANDGQYQKIMKSVTLPLVRSPTCQAQLRKTRLGRYFRLHESFVCAGGEAGQDSCKGDGGGPLACVRKGGDKDHYLLVGITAWGIGCGDEGVPGVYANVPFHIDWIKDQIEAVYPSTIAPPTTTQDCPSDCSSDFDPLCGNNGRTYGNPCELKMANCHDPTIKLKHQGECRKGNQKAKLQKKKKAGEKKRKRKQGRQQRREDTE